MAVRLYNTLTRKLEDFIPLHGQRVGLYTCGPTVYNTAHVGNLRTYIFEDVLRRTLEFNGYSVNQVMNITDVGHLTGDGDMGADKMEESARQEKKSAYDIAALHTKEFFDDLRRLNIELPSKTIKATDTIPLQIDLIKTLETNAFTYRTSDGVYFDTTKDPKYGRLSGQKSADKKAGARVEVNNEKRNTSDFALWKFSQPEDRRQMEWPSPWGIGFPGWHIECSAMSLSEFPHGLDIHCGGIDHISVHHENEIAQNEASGHHDFVKTWMHGEFLVLPGKRMGKSEGNALLLSETTAEPLFFRYLCLLTHYRKPLSFTPTSLSAAASSLFRLWTQISGATIDRSVKPNAQYLEQFTTAIDGDLNTPSALGTLHDLMNDKSIPPAEKISTLAVFDTVLALDLTPEMASQHLIFTTPDLEVKLEEYMTARKEKNYAVSDQLRTTFDNQGVAVEDLPDGTSRLHKK